MKKLLLPLLFLCLYGLSLRSTAQNCTTTIGADVTTCANVSIDIPYDLGGNYGSIEQLGNYEIGSVYGGGTYTYLANDFAKAKGKDTLILHNYGYFNYCEGMQTDTIVITLTPAPSITALSDIYICNTVNTITLGATFQLATGMEWTTGGTGTFAPDNTTPTATYTLTASDKAAGYFYIKGETTGNGTCNSEDDTIYVFITDPASLDVSVNAPEAICASDIVDLTANQYGGPVTTTQWSTSGSGVFSQPTNLTSSYTPSAADKATGSVTLTMSLIGPCPSVSNNATITIYDSESINVSAGSDLIQCYSNGSVTIDATAIGADNGVTWTIYSNNYYHGGFVDPNVEDPQYDFHYYDQDSPITLRITANQVGNCINTYDELILTVNGEAELSLDNDVDVCTNSDDESVMYSTDGQIIINSLGSVWTTSGTGTFVPEPSELATAENIDHVEYYFTAADMAAGSVTITIAVNAKPGCVNETETSVITFVEPPVVSAGSDQIVCDPEGTNNIIQMAASTPPVGYDGYWSSDDVSLGMAKTEKSSTQRQGREDAVASGGYTYPYADIAYEYDPESEVGLFYEGSATFYWNIEPGEGNYEGCYNVDSVVITRYHSIRGHNDMFEVESGDTVTYNLSRNDTLWGLPYTAVLYGTPSPAYPNNIAFDIEPAADDSIYFTYLNRDGSKSASDVLGYIVETSGDCAMKDTFLIMVSLVNGPPVIMDPAASGIQKQKETGVLTTVNVDLRTAYGDYNENINWSTLKLTDISGDDKERPDTFFNATNRYLMTLTYSSPKAKEFLGTQILTFDLCDSLGACNVLRYDVEILANYDNPSVKPEDFVVVNALSPNGDGVNDFLYIYGIAEYKTTVLIYNRWSEKVWEGENYDNKTVIFDGNYNVKSSGPLPEGTYFYVIKNENKNQNGEHTGLYSGYIELRR